MDTFLVVSLALLLVLGTAARSERRDPSAVNVVGRRRHVARILSWVLAGALLSFAFFALSVLLVYYAIAASVLLIACVPLIGMLRAASFRYMWGFPVGLLAVPAVGSVLLYVLSSRI